MEREGKKTATSDDIGGRADILGSQVRKDLSSLGQLGTVGRGYQVGNLRTEIERIMGKDRQWRIAIVGVGNLGSALLGYPQFKEEGFEIVAAFDCDMRKVGKTCFGVTVGNVRDLEKNRTGKEDSNRNYRGATGCCPGGSE